MPITSQCGSQVITLRTAPITPAEIFSVPVMKVSFEIACAFGV
jgi:hypothetical protein